MLDGKPILDLDYAEDAAADVDMNVVRIDDGRYVELQGGAIRYELSAPLGGLAIPEFAGRVAEPVVYDGETPDARIARRKQKWTPTEIVWR